MIDRPGRGRPQARVTPVEVSPKKLLVEIQRLLSERDRARRDVEKAHLEAQAAAEGRAELARERDDYLAALQRERAEFLNFKRRTSEERVSMLGLAAEDLIRKVLALADDFDRAIETRPTTIADDPWVEGITAIDRKLRLLLESRSEERRVGKECRL